MKSDNDSGIEFEWIEVNIDDDCKAVQPDTDAQPEVVETQQPESKAVSAVRNIFGYLIAVATAVLIYIVVSRFVVINANIPTRSMAPLIESEDRLMGFRMAYLFAEPKRGDVIIFRHKCYDDEEEQLLIKRIIGLPGDTIQITDNMVYINDMPYEETYLPDGAYMNSFGPYKVPENAYFVMGDNRTISNDARSWTYKDVTSDEIVARAWFKYYPHWEAF